MSIMGKGQQKAEHLGGSTETRRSRAIDRNEAIRALCGSDRVVYALRLPDGIIKIGCSGELDHRRNWFGAKTEVLGFVPGDFDDEAAVHARLVEHRARGHEYYHPTPEVLAVVNEMRDRFNLPHLAA